MPRLALWPSLLLVATLAGCQTGEATPGLLAVSDFSPREAEVGDRLEVIGTGFPEGKPATLSFRGDLYRPGQDPLHGVEIVAPATSTTLNRISLILTEKLQDEICGKGEDADHTTFRGDVVASFAARVSGAPPVSGSVHDIVLDVNGPAVATETVHAREAEGQRALTFLGLVLEPAAPHAPLVVAKVLPGSRAEAGGLLAGDVLVSVDGVSTRATSDLVFSGAQRQARISLRRGRLREPIERVVDVQGFRPAAPRELAVAAVLVGVVVLLFLSWLAPVSRIFSWIERRVATQLREKARAEQSGPFARTGRLISSVHASLSENVVPSGEPALLRLVPYVMFLGTSAAATMVAFGRSVVGKDLDLGLALAASVTLLVTVALISGGWRGRGRWSIASGSKSALSAVALQLPVIAAFGCVVLSTGSVRLEDQVHAQGPMPWEWHAFKNPVLFFAFGLLTVASFPRAQRPGELGEADLDADDSRAGLMFYVEWGHLLVVSTLGAMLFLGGWQLPRSLVPATGTVSLQVLGALLLQLKCWGVAGLVIALRWALPRVRTDQMSGVWWRWLLPLTCLALAASVAWAAGQKSPVLRTVEPVTGYVLFGLTLAAVGRFLRAVQVHVRAASAPMHVNPWL